MGGKTATILVGCLGLLVWLLAGGATPADLNPLTPLLGVAFILELVAPRLGRFGFLAAGQALLLGLVLHSGEALRPAIIVATGALFMRAFSRGHTVYRLAELVSDLAPFTGALVAYKMLAAPAVPVAYFVVWLTAPGLVSQDLERELAVEWGQHRSALVAQALGLAACIWLLSGAIPAQQAAITVIAAALALSAGASVKSVEAHVGRLEHRHREQQLQARQQGLAKIEESLIEAGQEQQRTATDIQVRLETYTMVEKMLESVTGRPALDKVAKAVIDRVRRKLPCQTVALFWKTDTGLRTLAAASPYHERLQASSLLRAQEPVVLRCLKLQKPERMIDHDRHAERIFPEEMSTLAVPMQDKGALYLGHPRDLEVNEDQLHFLQVLASHSVLALEAAAAYQVQQAALQKEAAAASKNEALVQRLAQVIDGVTQLVQVQEPLQMLERTGEIVQAIVPHDLRLVVGNELMVGTETVESLAATVKQNSKPLMLDYMEKSRFLPPVPEATAALGVPIVTDRGCLGAIVLVRCGGEMFQREDQDVLSVLSYQLGAALTAAQLYSELRIAHQQLKESQAQLVQSSKMAAIGQLAGGVAHELNTPLGAIALAVDGALANLRNKPERAESRLQRASQSVQQMKQIVAKLLFYSRDARSGRRETDLNQVIEDTLQMLAHQLKLDNVEVVTELAALPVILANQNELQQVFTNLCINARDAVLCEGARQRKIVIRTAATADAIWASMRDWGTGIAPDVRERIFEPFFTTKEVGKGTGLGLSVTMQLVQQHGGRLELGNPECGAEFKIMLPLQPSSEE